MTTIVLPVVKDLGTRVQTSTLISTDTRCMSQNLRHENSRDSHKSDIQILCLDVFTIDVAEKMFETRKGHFEKAYSAHWIKGLNHNLSFLKVITEGLCLS